MRYEIINPSDPYEMTCDDHEVATIAVTVLGGGMYPLRAKDGDESRDVPPLAFDQASKWCREKFGRSIEELADHVVDTKRAALIAALDSVTLLTKERTSLNDIGGHAKRIAKQLRTREPAAQAAQGK